MKRQFITLILALALTIGAQAQQDDGMDAMMAAMIAAKVHQDSIDTSSLVAVYDYKCQTQDADGKAVTDRMKVCLQVGQHYMRSFPYRKYRKEREWAEGEERAGTDFLQLRKREYMDGYDFCNDEELPMLKAENLRVFGPFCNCLTVSTFLKHPFRLVAMGPPLQHNGGPIAVQRNPY